jgi:hypothetical protein
VDRYVEVALADPVFDPESQIGLKFCWWPEKNISAILTCNIGME